MKVSGCMSNNKKRRLKKMDIGAYAKINDLSTILDSTGINIPRLRGLRLMAMEERITEEEIKEMTASAEVDAAIDQAASNSAIASSYPNSLSS